MTTFRPLAKRAKGKIQLVVGVPGIRKQRNHITQWFPEMTHIVSFDDDVRTGFHSMEFEPLISVVKRKINC